MQAPEAGFTVKEEAKMAIEKFETKNGFVQVPVKVFKAMQAQLEEREEIAAFDKAVARDEEAFPAEFVRELLEGKENRIKLYRKYRGLSQETLGKMAGCGKSMISQIEAGTTPGSIALLKKIAEALSVDLDDLV